MSDQNEPIVVLMSAPSSAEARRLAEMLVERRLAACVQVLHEMQSIYVWKDEVEHHSESLLIAKTTRANLDELISDVRAVHSYDNPEIIALPIVAGSQPYLDWLVHVVGSDPL